LSFCLFGKKKRRKRGIWGRKKSEKIWRSPHIPRNMVVRWKIWYFVHGKRIWGSESLTVSCNPETTRSACSMPRKVISKIITFGEEDSDFWNFRISRSNYIQKYLRPIYYRSSYALRTQSPILQETIANPAARYAPQCVSEDV